jgi:hypothetical protein
MSQIQGVRVGGAHFALGPLILDAKKSALAFDLPGQAPELLRVGVATVLRRKVSLASKGLLGYDATAFGCGHHLACGNLERATLLAQAQPGQVALVAC